MLSAIAEWEVVPSSTLVNLCVSLAISFEPQLTEVSLHDSQRLLVDS